MKEQNVIHTPISLKEKCVSEEDWPMIGHPISHIPPHLVDEEANKELMERMKKFIKEHMVVVEDNHERQYVTEQQAEHMLKMKEDILNDKLVLVLDKADREETKTKGTTKKLRPV